MVCSAMLPSERSRGRAACTGLQPSRGAVRVIDARGSLKVCAPPARPSTQPTARARWPPCQPRRHRSPPDTWCERGSDKMESQRGGTSRWQPRAKTQSRKNKAQGIHPRNKNPESPTFGLGVASWSCVFSDPRIQHPSSSIIPVSRDIVHFFFHKHLFQVRGRDLIEGIVLKK